MKQTITQSTFRDAFHAIRPGNFSYEALGLLFEHLEQMESDNGQEIELDVVAICCDYTEDSVPEIARNYSIDLNDADTEADDYEEQCRQIVFDYLSDNTSVVGDTAEGFVYVNF